MIISCDLLSVGAGAIVHQCNCRGVMGRGLALAIRNRWPIVYQHYRSAYDRGLLRLGTIQPVQVSPSLWVINLMGQDGWGTDRTRTDLDALRTAWPKVSIWAAERGLTVYAPWMIGCGLAGGDWAVVQPLVEGLCDVAWCRQ